MNDTPSKAVFASPLGDLLLSERDGALVGVDLAQASPAVAIGVRSSDIDRELRTARPCSRPILAEAHGRLEWTALSLTRLLAHLAPATGKGAVFAGTVAGKVSFSGAPSDPGTWKATVELGDVELHPAAERLVRANPVDEEVWKRHPAGCTAGHAEEAQHRALDGDRGA